MLTGLQGCNKWMQQRNRAAHLNSCTEEVKRLFPAMSRKLRERWKPPTPLSFSESRHKCRVFRGIFILVSHSLASPGIIEETTAITCGTCPQNAFIKDSLVCLLAANNEFQSDACLCAHKGALLWLRMPHQDFCASLIPDRRQVNVIPLLPATYKIRRVHIDQKGFPIVESENGQCFIPRIKRIKDDTLTMALEPADPKRILRFDFNSDNYPQYTHGEFHVTRNKGEGAQIHMTVHFTAEYQEYLKENYEAMQEACDKAFDDLHEACKTIDEEEETTTTSTNMTRAATSRRSLKFRSSTRSRGADSKKKTKRHVRLVLKAPDTEGVQEMVAVITMRPYGKNMKRLGKVVDFYQEGSGLQVHLETGDRVTFEPIDVARCREFTKHKFECALPTSSILFGTGHLRCRQPKPGAPRRNSFNLFVGFPGFFAINHAILNRRPIRCGLSRNKYEPSSEIMEEFADKLISETGAPIGEPKQSTEERDALIEKVVLAASRAKQVDYLFKSSRAIHSKRSGLLLSGRNDRILTPNEVVEQLVEKLQTLPVNGSLGISYNRSAGFNFGWSICWTYEGIVAFRDRSSTILLTKKAENLAAPESVELQLSDEIKHFMVVVLTTSQNPEQSLFANNMFVRVLIGELCLGGFLYDRKSGRTSIVGNADRIVRILKAIGELAADKRFQDKMHNAGTEMGKLLEDSSADNNLLNILENITHNNRFTMENKITAKLQLGLRAFESRLQVAGYQAPVFFATPRVAFGIQMNADLAKYSRLKRMEHEKDQLTISHVEKTGAGKVDAGFVSEKLYLIVLCTPNAGVCPIIPSAIVGTPLNTWIPNFSTRNRREIFVYTVKKEDVEGNRKRLQKVIQENPGVISAVVEEPMDSPEHDESEKDGAKAILLYENAQGKFVWGPSRVINSALLDQLAAGKSRGSTRDLVSKLTSPDPSHSAHVNSANHLSPHVGVGSTPWIPGGLSMAGGSKSPKLYSETTALDQVQASQLLSVSKEILAQDDDDVDLAGPGDRPFDRVVAAKDAIARIDPRMKMLFNIVCDPGKNMFQNPRGQIADLEMKTNFEKIASTVYKFVKKLSHILFLTSRYDRQLPGQQSIHKRIPLEELIKRPFAGIPMVEKITDEKEVDYQWFIFRGALQNWSNDEQFRNDEMTNIISYKVGWKLNRDDLVNSFLELGEKLSLKVKKSELKRYLKKLRKDTKLFLDSVAVSRCVVNNLESGLFSSFMIKALTDTQLQAEIPIATVKCGDRFLDVTVHRPWDGLILRSYIPDSDEECAQLITYEK